MAHHQTSKFKYNEDANSESESDEEPEENEGAEEDEGDNAPAMFQDEIDEEVQLQPQQGGHHTKPPCVICMDREPEVVLVPCGHQNICAPCAYQWKEENGCCPTDRREIQMIVTTIPL